MKRIIIILIVGLFLWINGNGQSIVPRSNNTVTVQDYRVFPKYNQFIPQYQDTTAANLQKGIDSCGALIFCFSTNDYWFRQSSPKKWVELQGSGNISITNIYNNSITNIFIFRDSCVILQNGSGTNLDTICTEFDCGITGWTITGSGTIQICGFVCPDTINIVCHNYTFPPQPFFLFDNGLTQVQAGHIQLGGTLLHTTGIDANYSQMNFYGRAIQNYPYWFRQYQTWTNSTGIAAFQNDYQNVRIGFNYTGDPIRTIAQGGYIPGYATPYKGYFLSLNGIGAINQPAGRLLVDSNTWKTDFIFFHGSDTASNKLISFGGFSPTYSGNTDAGNMSDSIALSILYNGKIQFPNYIHNSDANTDSAFYRDNTGVMKYGKVNTTSTNIYNSDGTLTGDRILTGGSQTLTMNFNTSGSNPGFIVNQSSTFGKGIQATSDVGYAVYGLSNGGYGVRGFSTGGPGISGASVTQYAVEGTTNSETAGVAYFNAFPSSTNTVVPSIKLDRVTSGTAADGIGQSIVFQGITTVQDREANTIISKWSTATDASRTSQLIITGVNSAVTADLFTLSGSGSLKLNKYGSGTFTGSTAFLLGVDASGNVIEITPPAPEPIANRTKLENQLKEQQSEITALKKQVNALMQYVLGKETKKNNIVAKK